MNAPLYEPILRSYVYGDSTKEQALNLLRNMDMPEDLARKLLSVKEAEMKLEADNDYWIDNNRASYDSF